MLYVGFFHIYLFSKVYIVCFLTDDNLNCWHLISLVLLSLFETITSVNCPQSHCQSDSKVHFSPVLLELKSSFLLQTSMNQSELSVIQIMKTSVIQDKVTAHPGKEEFEVLQQTLLITLNRTFRLHTTDLKTSKGDKPTWAFLNKSVNRGKRLSCSICYLWCSVRLM